MAAAAVSGQAIRSVPASGTDTLRRGLVAMPPRADSLCSLRVLSILTRSSQVMWTVSLYLDVGRFDDRPPFFDLGFVIDCKRLRRLLVWRWNLLALLSKSLPHYRVG